MAIPESGIELSSSLVTGKIVAIFPTELREQAAGLLAQVQGATHQERLRLQLALLRLCETAPDRLAALRDTLEAAALDARDVLLAAEYPQEAKLGGPLVPREDLMRLRQADTQQYLEWLQGVMSRRP